MPKEIFLDESGNSGGNLLDSAQPVLTLATLQFSEAEASDLKREYFPSKNWGAQASELKYGSVTGDKRHRMVSDFLRYLAAHPDRVKIHISNKRFVLHAKIVDYLIAPVMEADGFDPHKDGMATALASVQYLAFDGAAPVYFDLVLAAFQQFVRAPMADHLAHFTRTLCSHQGREHLSAPLSKALEKQLIVPVMAGIFDGIVNPALDFSYENLDLSFTAASSLMYRWAADLNDEIILIHDESSVMAGEKNVWEELAKNHGELKFEINGNALKRPSILKTEFLRSESRAGLQLADLAAGAAMTWFKGKIKSDLKTDEVERLDKIFSGMGACLEWLDASHPDNWSSLGGPGSELLDQVTEELKDAVKQGLVTLKPKKARMSRM